MAHHSQMGNWPFQFTPNESNHTTAAEITALTRA